MATFNKIYYNNIVNERNFIMNSDYYVIFDFDNEQKLIFIEKHHKDDTILKKGTYQEMEAYGNTKIMKKNAFK